MTKRGKKKVWVEGYISGKLEDFLVLERSFCGETHYCISQWVHIQDLRKKYLWKNTKKIRITVEEI